MQQNLNVNNAMKGYINLAKTGHYPLFFEEWLNDSLKEGTAVSYRSASENVKDLFKKMAKHRSLERKRTMLTGLPEEQRDQFIRSFFKLVERDILKDLKSLQ